MRCRWSGRGCHDMESLREMLYAFADVEGCRESLGRCGFSTAAAPDASATFLHGRRIDFHQSVEAYFAYVDVSGLKVDSLRVLLHEGRIAVMRAAAPNSPDAPGPSETPARQWEVIGSYELPDDAVKDAIFAQVSGGELFVSIPRTPKDPAVEVPIVDGNADGWVNVGASKED